MQKIIDTLIFLWIIYCEGLTFPTNMVIKTKSGRFFLLHSDYEEKNEPTVISPPDVTSTGPETTTEITTSPPAVNSVPDVTTTGLETTIEITTSMPVRCAGEYGDCCNPSHPCDVGDGDCDENEDCMEGLTCGFDNCPQFGGIWEANDDCCQKSDDYGETTAQPKGSDYMLTDNEDLPGNKRNKTLKGFHHTHRPAIMGGKIGEFVEEYEDPVTTVTEIRTSSSTVYGETTAQPKGSDYMLTDNEDLPEGNYTDGSKVTMEEEEYDGEEEYPEDYEQNWVNNDYYYD